MRLSSPPIPLADLKKWMEAAYIANEDSIIRSAEMEETYHNKHYTAAQLNILKTRGQPAETFNVIKSYTNMLKGYFSTVINTVKIYPSTEQAILRASISNDVVNHIFQKNDFDLKKDKLLEKFFVAGLAVIQYEIKHTGKSDEFGIPFLDVGYEIVPTSEVILDPMSRQFDYTDARYIHRYKWVHGQEIEEKFGEDVLKQLIPNSANLGVVTSRNTIADKTFGTYRMEDKYILVCSNYKYKGKKYLTYWSGEVHIETYDISEFPVDWILRPFTYETVDIGEYYGLFEEVYETQKAINQAVIQIQLMANTNKVLVEKGSVDDMAAFQVHFNKVNSIIPTLVNSGIRIDSLSGDIQQQYMIISNALTRIQKILGINESFLGMANASDSGKKVAIQQNASIVALRAPQVKVQSMLKLIAKDTLIIASHTMRAHQLISIIDPYVGAKFIEINKPKMIQIGVDPMTGFPVMDSIVEPAETYDNGLPILDENGRMVVKPIYEQDSLLDVEHVNLEITTAPYNDVSVEDQQSITNVLAGPMGQMVASINPSGYLRAGSLSLKSMKNKYSEEIASIIQETAAMVNRQPQQPMQQPMQQDGSQDMGPGAGRVVNMPGMADTKNLLGR